MVEPITMALLAGGMTGVNIATSLWKGKQDLEAAREAGRISEQQALELADAYAKLEAGWELPPGEAPTLSPVQLELMGKYNPEIAKQTIEQAPQMVPQGGLGRDAQIKALDKLGAMSVTGTDAISQAAQSEAKFKADAASTLRQQEILNNYANRGLLNGATGLSAQLSAAQDAGAQQELAAQQAAAQAQQRRMDALSQFGNTAGQIRQSDDSASRTNAEIMNMYNQRMANSMNDYNRYRTAQLNDAQKANLAEQQRISDANRTSQVNTANTNAVNNFNAQNNRIAAGNQFLDKKLQGTKDVLSVKSQGKLGQLTAENTAKTGMVGGITAAGTTGIGQAISAYSGQPKTSATETDPTKKKF